MDTILLLEGVEEGDYLASYEDDPLEYERSNKKMAGTKKGTKTKTRPRARRSLFGGGSLGGGFLEDAKPIIVTGGLAAAGAWVSRTIAEKLRGTLNTEPGSMTENLLIIAIGIALGGAVGKFGKTQKYKDYGIALGVGATAIGLLNFIGTMTPSPTAGWGLLTAEPAPYARPAALPPLSQFPASGLYDQSAIAI